MDEETRESQTRRLPPVIAFLAGRGGTGKTSTCVNMGALVAETGNNVLILDLDLSGKGATHLIRAKAGQLNCQTLVDLLDKALDHDENVPAPASHDVWQRGLPVDGPTLLNRYGTGQVLGALHFVPAAAGRLRYMRHKISEYEALPTADLQNLLTVELQRLSDEFDLKCIFLDCPAASNNFSEAAGWIADYAVIVTQPDKVSRAAAADLEGVLLTNIPEDRRPQIGWVVNKITPNYAPETLDMIFQDVDVLAYIPFEDRVAATYGEITFARELGFSTFEIKLQMVCHGLFRGKHPHLVPDPVKMLPVAQLNEMQRDLRLRLGRLAKILKVAVIASIVLACGCFVPATVASILTWLAGGVQKPVIDPSTGEISLPQDTHWYHTFPTAALFVAGFLCCVLGGIAAYYYVRQKRKNERARVEPVKLMRNIMLSPDKSDLVQ